MDNRLEPGPMGSGLNGLGSDINTRTNSCIGVGLQLYIHTSLSLPLHSTKLYLRCSSWSKRHT